VRGERERDEDKERKREKKERDKEVRDFIIKRKRRGERDV